ncbi:hypothetical protein LCGC14_2473670 [marine sediment metagenome]|uniref:Homing endonuclease LAGLIDADG domain-containing protein n=1 Tax=marine sediment metagenome TaxID=412755 RepID=A0A0F9E3H4_9ZZZZ
MSLVEAAALGMLIEAEGTVVRTALDRVKPHWEISFCNSDLELISMALRLTQVGRVYLKKPSPGGIRSNYLMWTWGCYAQANIEDLARQISPYCMKARRILASL